MGLTNPPSVWTMLKKTHFSCGMASLRRKILTRQTRDFCRQNKCLRVVVLHLLSMILILSPNIGCKVHKIKSSLPSLLLASFKKIWNLSNACSCCRVSFVHTESSASRSKGLSRKDSQSSSEDAHTDLHKKKFSLSDHFKTFVCPGLICLSKLYQTTVKTFVCPGLIVRRGWSKSDKLYTCV